VCGIAGAVNFSGEPVASGLLRRMADVMAHRGPDGEGYYQDGGVGLAHRRLAVIDLSPAGHQPMANETGDVVITFNGEIYNFQPLRVELEALGHRFHSQTDTETIVHAYEQWGADCLKRLNGMFAFAIYDRRASAGRGRLFLARDRYGVKPLYWFADGGTFVFASEIKAILKHPRVSPRVCHAALNEYFTFQNIFTDLTLFEGIRLLPPGCSLTLECGAAATPTPARYWDYPFDAPPQTLSFDESADRLYDLFVQSVTRQLVSDVPVGSYLSGGMDSGSITAVAVRHLPRLLTFTGGFDLSSASGMELGFDERPAAEFLANRMKTEHYEIVMHAGDMEWVLPRLIWHLEDLRVGQCYPNFYTAGLASKFVTVVLSGAGGDELFAGYPWRYYPNLSSDGRDDYLMRYYQFWQRLVPDDEKVRLFNASTAGALDGARTFDVFKGVFQHAPFAFDGHEDYLNASLYFELKTFLHGLLVVEDKLSMAHSLETRVPFLDDDLVDFAVRMPASHKMRDIEHVAPMDENAPGKRLLYERVNHGKAVLRRAMSRLVPSDITDRTKQGFSAPDASWFRGESIDYINKLLRSPKARLYEFINPEYVAAVLDQHCSGHANRRLLIWSLLSFEWWCRAFLDGLTPDPLS
jgi:asparagine synthase (glutamine-hydrolysing)